MQPTTTIAPSFKSISEVEAYIESLPKYISIDFDYRKTVETIFNNCNHLNLNKSYEDFTRWYKEKYNVRFDEHEIDYFSKLENRFIGYFAQFNTEDKAKEYFKELGLKCEYIYHYDKDIDNLTNKGFELFNMKDKNGYGNICVYDFSKPKIKYNTMNYSYNQENALKHFYKDDSIYLSSIYAADKHKSDKGTFKNYSYGFELDHENTKQVKETLIALIKDIYKDRPLAIKI